MGFNHFSVQKSFSNGKRKGRGWEGRGGRGRGREGGEEDGSIGRYGAIMSFYVCQESLRIFAIEIGEI